MEKITYKKIQEITKDIAKKIRPEKVILFGSFIWGKPSRDSDIDLLIIKNTKKNKRRLQIEIGKVLFGCGIPVDTIIYRPQEIQERLKKGDWFLEEIINKGKVLYEKNKSSL